MNKSIKLTEDISLLSFLEAIDLDLLLTGMNEAPVDMPSILSRFNNIKARLTLTDTGPNKSEVVKLICAATDLGADEVNRLIEDTEVSIFDLNDVDMATILRDKLIKQGVDVKVKYV